MARSGGFGGGLNPLGGGSFGGLGKYDIGADLADLEVYRVEVAWGNGLATDAEYIAALTTSRDATDPDTQRRESAQNKLDDAVYRIGRSKAAAKGLDDVIAFDQKAIGTMRPDNLRYRDVKDSLDSELAQRRSRDYGNLVLDYNRGKTSTQTLLGWVNKTLKTINPDDPDFDNWTSTQADLTDRVASERDAKVYQDFQQGRMKAEPFLAYLTTRRNGFDKTSPQYADWDRRLEDARKQVGDQKQAATDTAFFNSYEEGHKSDTQYLAYLRGRISRMKSDDPDRATWQHRLNQAAFSLAEDKLRFDVEHRKQPVSRLIAFYRHYRATLNPGSAEWRTVTRALDSLHAGGVGGGRRRTTKGPGSPTVGLAITAGKVITATTIDGALALMTINPYAKSKDQKAAKKFFDLNYTSLENARQRGDEVFLFFDPRHPGTAIAGRNPDGSPMLDANGKPVMVRGSSYLPVTDDMFGQMNVLKADYHYQLAEIALHDKDPGKYADNLRQALNAQDKARLVGSQSIQKSYDAFYEQAQAGIDSALRSGDYATAMNLSTEMASRIANELNSNPALDETRRDRLNRLGEKLTDNPLVPKVDPITGKQIGGAIDLAGSTRDAHGNFTNVALNPGWHHVLDKQDAAGAAAWGLQYDDVQDGSWEQTHRTITTGYGKAVVTGEVSVRRAGVNPTVFVTTPDGMIRVDQSAQYMTFTDENGHLVRAYSLDGVHWIRSLSGTAPQVEVNANLRNAADGSGLVDDNGKLVFKAREPGNKDAGYTFVGDQSLLGWYGQADRLAGGAPRTAHEREDLGPTRPRDLGAPGQHMQFLTAASDGTLTFLSDRQQDDYEKKLLGLPIGGATRKPGPGYAIGGSLDSPTTHGGTGITLSPSGILALGMGLKAALPPPAKLPSLPPIASLAKKAVPTLPPALPSVIPPLSSRAQEDLGPAKPKPPAVARARRPAPKRPAPPPPTRTPSITRYSHLES